jgi:hypothetical protein
MAVHFCVYSVDGRLANSFVDLLLFGEMLFSVMICSLIITCGLIALLTKYEMPVHGGTETPWAYASPIGVLHVSPFGVILKFNGEVLCKNINS